MTFIEDGNISTNVTKLYVYLHTDASGYALGAVLSQKDPDDGDKEYVCANGSRGIKGAELHYGITEKDCLAEIYVVKLFRIYLYGVKFKIITY